MSVANHQVLVPLKANADLSAAAKQYTLVKVAAAGAVTTSSAATDQSIGVQQDRAASGAAVAVAVAGRCQVKAGASLSVGDKVTSDGSGRAVATTTDKQWYVGIVVTGVSNADEIAEILVMPGCMSV